MAKDHVVLRCHWFELSQVPYANRKKRKMRGLCECEHPTCYHMWFQFIIFIFVLNSYINNLCINIILISLLYFRLCEDLLFCFSYIFLCLLCGCRWFICVMDNKRNCIMINVTRMEGRERKRRNDFYFFNMYSVYITFIFMVHLIFL